MPTTHNNPDDTGAGDRRDLALTELSRSISDFLPFVASHIAEREAREHRWRIFKRDLAAVAAVGFVATWVALYAPMFGWSRSPSTEVIAVVPIEGAIGSSALDGNTIAPVIRRACESPMTKAVVLRIDSPGGSPSDAEQIGASLAACKADGRSIPVIAVIEGTGASASYLVAAHADEIFAGRYSIVGSLGAVLRTFDASELAGRHGIRERIYASGPLKAGNGAWTSNTPEQDALTQSLVDSMAAAFADQVRQLRKDHLVETADLFTGRVWVSADALRLGLIDGISSFDQLHAERFDSTPLHVYRSRQTFHERLGLSSMVHALATDFTTAAAAPRWE